MAYSFYPEQAVVLGAREGHWSDLPGLAQCMRASMLLPGICGPPITLDSMQGAKEPLADAMLFEPIPYRAALAEGATHVLVLRTRPDGVNLVRKQSAPALTPAIIPAITLAIAPTLPLVMILPPTLTLPRCASRPSSRSSSRTASSGASW